MNRNNCLMIILSFSLLLLFIWGCGELEKGNYPTNALPQLYLVNIPQEDAGFSVNPRVYWWGTDADGRVVEFQYVVIPESKLNMNGEVVDLGLIPKDANGFIDSLFVMALEKIPPTKWVDSLVARELNQAGYLSHYDDSLIAVIDTQTSVNMVMFAELDTTVYVNQYFFVRAVDNNGALSKIWKPNTKGGHVFRRLARNNHPPNTHIDTINFAKTGVYYCLPETTETWKGIKIRWEGSDSSDYPRKQPDFYYKWEILGPFEDSLNVDLSAVVDSSWDAQIGSRWVFETSRTFVNLKNFNEEAGGNHGWYLFRIISRDEAFVEDESPASVFIHVVHPLIDFWPENQRNVLFVDVSKFGSRKAFGFPVEEEGRTGVLSVYEQLLLGAQMETGISFDIWYDSTTGPKALSNPPNELLLSKYKLVILANHCKESGMAGTGVDSGYTQYKNYLDVGGNVWFVGMNNWTIFGGGWHSTSSTDRLSEFYGHTMLSNLARFYFGLYDVFFPSWVISERNEEFIGAKPFLRASVDLPYLESDSSKVEILLRWDFREDPSDTVYYEPKGNALPQIGAVVLSPWTERLYDFVSMYGVDSELNGKPCAVRFTGATFKTSEFCFPLYLMKDDAAREAMTVMINWFLEPTLP